MSEIPTGSIGGQDSSESLKSIASEKCAIVCQEVSVACYPALCASHANYISVLYPFVGRMIGKMLLIIIVYFAYQGLCFFVFSLSYKHKGPIFAPRKEWGVNDFRSIIHHFS